MHGGYGDLNDRAFRRSKFCQSAEYRVYRIGFELLVRFDRFEIGLLGNELASAYHVASLENIHFVDMLDERVGIHPGNLLFYGSPDFCRSYHDEGNFPLMGNDFQRKTGNPEKPAHETAFPHGAEAHEKLFHQADLLLEVPGRFPLFVAVAVPPRQKHAQKNDIEHVPETAMTVIPYEQNPEKYEDSSGNNERDSIHIPSISYMVQNTKNPPSQKRRGIFLQSTLRNRET